MNEQSPDGVFKNDSRILRDVCYWEVKNGGFNEEKMEIFRLDPYPKKPPDTISIIFLISTKMFSNEIMYNKMISKNIEV